MVSSQPWLRFAIGRFPSTSFERRDAMKDRLAAYLLVPGTLLIGAASCGGSSSSSGGSAGAMDVQEVSHGFGQLLPHRVFELAPDGTPTPTVIAIRNQADLVNNVRDTNPIFANTEWPTGAILPNTANLPGNHFVYVRFTQAIDFDSVITKAANAQSSSNLTGSIQISAVDPVTLQVSPIRGRAFVGGRTVGSPDPADPTLLLEEEWVGVDANGKPVALLVGGSLPGLGFPYTENPFGPAGTDLLVQDDVFLFIPDTDGDLTTHETFPTGTQINIRVLPGVRSTGGEPLLRPALASATVGVDVLSPEALGNITPANATTDVDPRTNILVEFTEPVQPFSVGPLPTGSAPTLSGAVQIQFGPTGSPVPVPFTALPVSVLDLTRYVLDPSFDFPGEGPPALACGVLNRVDVMITPGAVRDLKTIPNLNQSLANSFFETGEGPGLVNAPVTPDVIFVGRIGSLPGISTIDLNGFGAGTGNPTYDQLQKIKRGNSNYPNNPNLIQSTSLFPPLATQGQCTFDGGSEGVFTLTKDSSLDSRLVKPPLITSISDMMLGRALDTTFNNGPPPFGCQAGGGNLCASSSLKLVAPITTGTNTIGPTQPGQFSNIFPGLGNLASWAPHPNPPPLVFPPLCISPLIGGQEPTSIDDSTGAVFGNAPPNLLGPSDNFLGSPTLGLPPAGLATREQNAFFLGPSAPQSSVTLCTPYQIRQQIGYFLYVVDRVRREVIVLNSNRFTVIDRIQLPDPTALAMSPNLDFLAVTNQSAGTVSFIDINPASGRFHEVIKSTKVEQGPRGLAWEPGNEDLLVCNEQSNSVSIISSFSLNVRKTLRNQLNRPFDVAVTQRQVGFGFTRNVYFAFILNRDGSVALFESGPNGVNGWGFDEIIGKAAFQFAVPKAITPDPINLDGGCWIVHENPIDPGTGKQIGFIGQPAVSNMVLASTTAGQQSLELGAIDQPHLRDVDFRVRTSIGPDQLTGIPVDIAFDNLMNFAGLPNTTNSFSAGSPIQANGKSQVKNFANVNEPNFMFLAVPTSSEGGGVVDVIRMDTGFRREDTDPFLTGTQSIPAQGVAVLMDFFRQ